MVPGWFRGPTRLGGYPAGRDGLGSPGPGGGTDSTAAGGPTRATDPGGGARIRKYISTIPTGRGASRASSSRTPGPQTGLAPVRGVDGTLVRDYQGAPGARRPRVGGLEGAAGATCMCKTGNSGGIPPKNLLTPTSEPQIPGFRSGLGRVPVNLGNPDGHRGGEEGPEQVAEHLLGDRDTATTTRNRSGRGGLRRIGDLFAPRGSAVHPVLIPEPRRQVPRNG